jgi:3-oxoacyl-(acyl-carrier-protein) synthase
MTTAEPLAITGFASISAAAIDDDEALSRLIARGDTAIARAARFARPDPGWTGSVAEQLEQTLAPLPDGVPARLCVDWATRVGTTALARAGIGSPGRPTTARMGLILASNLEDHPRTLGELAHELGDRLGIAGPRLVASMACASSIAALALARLAIVDLDAVLLIGSDVLTPRVAGGFRQLGLLSDVPCSPFSERIGTSLGEGAAAFVIEAQTRALDPARIVATVLGVGVVAEAHHPTTPEPNGRGTRAAVEAGLAEARCTPADIELIAAHGTGTEANDHAELRGFVAAGLRLAQVPVVALKSVFGHAQGAASAIELAGLLVAWSRDLHPMSAGFERPRVLDVEVRTPSRSADPPSKVLLTSAGFGGTCAAAVVTRGRAASHEPTEQRAPARALYLRERWQTIGWGADGDAIDWRRALRGIDLRNADPSTRLLTLCVARALERTRDPDVGLIVATARSSVAAAGRLREQIEQHGIEQASASVFTEPLLIMPAGACTRTLDLQGPFGLCVARGIAAPLSICWAADRLRRQLNTSQMVAACVDEREHGPDGAAAFVLGDRGRLRLAGWSIVGCGRIGDGLDRACARAGCAHASLDDHLHVIATEVEQGVRALVGSLERLTPGQRVAVSVEEPGSGVVTLVFATSTG